MKQTNIYIIFKVSNTIYYIFIIYIDIYDFLNLEKNLKSAFFNFYGASNEFFLKIEFCNKKKSLTNLLKTELINTKIKEKY